MFRHFLYKKEGEGIKIDTGNGSILIVAGMRPNPHPMMEGKPDEWCLSIKAPEYMTIKVLRELKP